MFHKWGVRGIIILTAIMVLGSLFLIRTEEGRTNNSRITGLAIGPGAAPAGFASPHDPYDNNRQLATLTYKDNGDGTFDVTANINHPGGYVYYRGYYLSRGQWAPFTFPQPTVQGSHWIRENASINLTDLYNNHVIRSNDEEFVVAFYSCKRYNGVWRCGCRSQNDCNYWSLQSTDLGDGWTGQYLEVSPRETITTHPSTFNVDITLNGGTNIYGFDIEIEYDPTIIEYQGITPGNYFGTTYNTNGADFLCVNETASNGIISKIACTRTGTDLNKGTGNIIETLQFRTLQPGYSQIRIIKTEVAEWPDVAQTGTQPTITNWPANNGAVIVE